MKYHPHPSIKVQVVIIFFLKYTILKEEEPSIELEDDEPMEYWVLYVVWSMLSGPSLLQASKLG